MTNVRPSTPEDEDAKLRPFSRDCPKRTANWWNRNEYCPILPENRLGSMGEPVKLMIEGQAGLPVLRGLQEESHGIPKETLAKVAKLKLKKSAPSNKSNSGEVSSRDRRPMAKRRRSRPLWPNYRTKIARLPSSSGFARF